MSLILIELKVPNILPHTHGRRYRGARRGSWGLGILFLQNINIDLLSVNKHVENETLNNNFRRRTLQNSFVLEIIKRSAKCKGI